MCSCPVVSLSYLPRAASSLFPCGGLIAGSLEGGCFWEQVEGTTYRQHILPLESGGCTDIQVEPESRHCLVTYRPGEPFTINCYKGTMKYGIIYTDNDCNYLFLTLKSYEHNLWLVLHTYQMSTIISKRQETKLKKTTTDF